MRPDIFIFPILMIMLVVFYFSHPEEQVCDETGLKGIFTRLLVHQSFWHLIVNLWLIFQLFELERLIGPLKTVILTAWLALLTTIIQYYDKGYVQEYRKAVHKNYLLRELKVEEQNVEELLNITQTPPPPCNLGFSGLVMALQIVLLYLTAGGTLASTWRNFQWIALQIIPTLLLAEVSIHNQVSGFVAGIVTIVMFDFLRKI